MSKPRVTQRKERARIRAREWCAKYPARAKWSRELGYITYRDKRLAACRAYAKRHPHINKESVAKWQAAHPEKDPKEYRITGHLRERCLGMWGDQCGMCHRHFEPSGGLRAIAHHLDYEPVERVVFVCYQCHNLIHGRKAYWHPFLKLGGDTMPQLLHAAVAKLDLRVIEIDRPHPHSTKTINTRARVRWVLNEDRAVDLDKGEGA